MRVLIVQRSLAPPGGGNAVAAWMVQALLEHHQVGTLTAQPWAVDDTNAFYGTSIPQGAVTQHVVPRPWRWLANLPEAHLTRLRMASVYGASRALASRYDVMITAEYYAAFPIAGIQYVQFPAALRPQPERWPMLVNTYFALCERLLGARWTDAARNLTLANSQWTANGLEQLGELPHPMVLYPPVLDPGSGRSWADRDDTFLIVGRFTSSKRIEAAMEVVRRVRAQSIPHARLIVIGSAVDAGYTARLRQFAETYGDWIEFREDLSRSELYEQMRRSRYGIHAMDREHFGMATAEMTRAGCLVFAHASGGSTEVLNHEGSLLWSAADEAVQKINAVAAQPAETIDALRSRLRAHSEIFSTENFVRRCQQIVAAQVS